MIKPYLFEDVVELQAFAFPDSYLRTVMSGNLPQIDPWWFLVEEPDKSNLFFRVINYDRKSKKILVPFAKIDDGSGDVACFDGDDHSGDPQVYFSTGTDSLEDVDWERRFSLADFDSWLSTARQEAGL
jgi:hypothetical protein